MATAAWLIERKDVHLCYSKSGACGRWVGFSDPQAWRFESKSAGEKIVQEHDLRDVVVVEHEWSCGNMCTLAADVVAAVYAPHQPPRELMCRMDHPHRGQPHQAEGWAWWDGRIWRAREGSPWDEASV